MSLFRRTRYCVIRDERLLRLETGVLVPCATAGEPKGALFTSREAAERAIENTRQFDAKHRQDWEADGLMMIARMEVAR